MARKVDHLPQDSFRRDPATCACVVIPFRRPAAAEKPGRRHPGSVAGEDGSPLERTVGRIGEAIGGDAAGRVPAAFRGLVPGAVTRLRSRALGLTGDVAEADGLVRAALLMAWTRKGEPAASDCAFAWIDGILRERHASGAPVPRLEVADPDAFYAAAEAYADRAACR